MARVREPDNLPRPGRPAGAVDDGMPFDHIIVVMMETHSLDNALGGLSRSGQPAAEGATFDNSERDDEHQSRRPPATVTAFPVRSAAHGLHVSQTWNATHEQIGGGKLDGFVCSVNATQAMGYHPREVLPFVYDLAATFKAANRWFCSAPCQTFPAGASSWPRPPTATSPPVSRALAIRPLPPAPSLTDSTRWIQPVVATLNVEELRCREGMPLLFVLPPRERVGVDIRLLGAGSIGSGSGKRSLEAPRARKLGSRRVCCRVLVSGGSARVAGCRPSASRRCPGVICPSPSARRSRCCSLVAAGCVRSRVGSVVHRRRSPESCNATLRSDAAELNIERRPLSGMRSVAPGGLSRRSSL